MLRLLVCTRWAVSSVMTRQNQIPLEDGSGLTLALIPLWDMCNHMNGLVSLQSPSLALITGKTHMTQRSRVNRGSPSLGWIV